MAKTTSNKTIIVVAAFDKTFIDSCLDSLGDKYPVIVMDTSGGGHPTGAYLKAWEQHPADNYLFMQDSMRSTVDDPVEPFAKLMPPRGAVAWCLFKEGFDSADQEAWARKYYKGEYPGVGIFGPVFYTSRRSLQELKDKHLLPPVPKNRAEAQTTERMWSWAFFNADMQLGSVAGWWDYGRMRDGSYPPFIKTFAGRP